MTFRGANNKTQTETDDVRSTRRQALVVQFTLVIEVVISETDRLNLSS